MGFEPTISTLARLRDTGLRYDRKFGSGARARTEDPTVNSRVLCQLSYTGIDLLDFSRQWTTNATALTRRVWLRRPASNRRPPGYESGTLAN